MDIEHFRRRLLEKERELLAEIAQLEREMHEPSDAEVGDAIDQATAAAIQATALGESSLQRSTLALVRDALHRTHEGQFGDCVDCGRPIEPARLEAVPWTPYCRTDQEKHDRAS